jgi:hypothetical protein
LREGRHGGAEHGQADRNCRHSSDEHEFLPWKADPSEIWSRCERQRDEIHGDEFGFGSLMRQMHSLHRGMHILNFGGLESVGQRDPTVRIGVAGTAPLRTDPPELPSSADASGMRTTPALSG